MAMVESRQISEEVAKAIKVKMDNLEEFIAHPFIGMSLDISTNKSGKIDVKIVAHKDAPLTEAEKAGTKMLGEFPLVYKADGIHVSDQKTDSSPSL